MQGKLASEKGRIAGLISAQKSDEQIVDELYLATYARLPTAPESAAIRELIAGTTNRKEVFEDLLWTLLNSPEFAFNH